MYLRRLFASATLPAALMLTFTGAMCTGEKTAHASDGQVGASSTPAASASSLKTAVSALVPPPAPFAPVAASNDDQRAFMTQSARAAWRYVTREVTGAGFVGATKNYQFLTVWDMGSELAAAMSARELGFITPA